MRCLMLHLRARRVPGAVVAVALVALLAARTGNWLMERPIAPDALHQLPVAALGALVVAGVLATTLGSPHELLDRSTPAPWRWIRSVHLVLAALLGSAALGWAGLGQAGAFGAPAMIRDVVGLLGIGGLAAAVVGARAAWVVVLAYATAVYVAAPGTVGGWASWWAWPVQPTQVTTSFVTAAALLVVGIGVHALAGAAAGEVDHRP